MSPIPVISRIMKDVRLFYHSLSSGGSGATAVCVFKGLCRHDYATPFYCWIGFELPRQRTQADAR